MPYTFSENDHPTIGVEIELQIVDAETGLLTNRVNELLDRVPDRYRPFFKHEFMQSYCEICTDVCHSMQEVEQDLRGKFEWAQDTLEDLGLRFLWSGTHPISRWDEQKVSPGDRYAWLLDTMQDVARRLVCFGLHVHVGLDSGDKAVHLCDRMLRHIPTLLALSANSPFWCGRDTGMASYRSKVMEALPTAGLPQTMRNWSEYCWLVENLVSTGFIQTIKEIWWDVRPHHEFGTIELRIMDQPLNLRHTLGLVALTQALVFGIAEEINRGAYLLDCHPMIAKQNKWHATRFGMDATFIDSDTLLAVPARQMSVRLLERCMPIAERLGAAEYLAAVQDIIHNGTGTRRQRRVYDENESLDDVVRFLIQEGEQVTATV